MDRDQAKAPVVIVHDLSHARAALAAAEAAGAPVTLLSPPGAAAYLGPLYFQAMIRLAAESHPKAIFRVLLDCGDRPGDVLAALRQGLSDFVFHGEGPLRDRLGAIAEAKGARLLLRPQADLDCAGTPEPAAACAGLFSSRPC